jgi:hypothetical protein
MCWLYIGPWGIADGIINPLECQHRSVLVLYLFGKSRKNTFQTDTLSQHRGFVDRKEGADMERQIELS